MAALLWEIRKVILECYLYILLIITLSQKKTNCNPLAHHIWKCHHTNLDNAKLLKSNWRFFKRWRLWRELAGSGYNGPWLQRADTSEPTQSHQIVVDRTGEADWLIRKSYKLKLIWRMRRCVTPVGAAGDSRSRKSWTAWAWSSPHIADSFTSPAMRNRVE